MAGPARGRTPPTRPVPCPLPFPLIPKWVERPRLSRTPRASTCGGWDYRTRAPGAGLCPPCVRRVRDPACARATPHPSFSTPTFLFLCSPSDGTTRACVCARALPPKLWERERSGERKGGAGRGVERAGGRGVCSLCVCKERLASRLWVVSFSLFRASPIVASRAGEGRGPIEGETRGVGGNKGGVWALLPRPAGPARSRVDERNGRARRGGTARFPHSTSR